MATTIRAVAEAAGVSITTVSFVLNNRRPQVDAIPKATRERVRACAAALGYRRNPAAATLRTGRSQWIGVVMQAMEDESNAWFWATSELAMLSSIQKTLCDKGYFTVLGSKIDDNQSLDALIASGVGGIILRCPPPKMVKQAQSLANEGFPIAVVFPSEKMDLYPYSIDMDNRRAGQMAAELLVKANRKRLMCVVCPQAKHLREERSEGFIDTVKKELGEETIICELPSWEIAQNMAILTKAVREYRPDGILCTDAGSAFLVSLAAERLEIEVPDELAIIGFDCYAFRGARQQRLSSVGASWWQAGQVAAENVIDMISNEVVWTEPKMIEPRFVWGHTTPPELAEGCPLPWVI